MPGMPVVGRPTIQLQTGCDRLRPNHWRHRQLLESRHEEDALLNYWQSVVSDFTLRDLTMPMDKLPALSGLTNNARLLSGDEYYAGLWRSCFPIDLLWVAKAHI
jgi:hypothetical protein